MTKKIELKPLWREQIKCLRCFLDGRHDAGKMRLVGEEVLWQLMIAIDEAKP